MFHQSIEKTGNGLAGNKELTMNKTPNTICVSRLGTAGQGEAGQGMARRGMVRQGKANNPLISFGGYFFGGAR